MVPIMGTPLLSSSFYYPTNLIQIPRPPKSTKMQRVYPLPNAQFWQYWQIIRALRDWLFINAIEHVWTFRVRVNRTVWFTRPLIVQIAADLTCFVHALKPLTRVFVFQLALWLWSIVNIIVSVDAYQPVIRGLKEKNSSPSRCERHETIAKGSPQR